MNRYDFIIVGAGSAGCVLANRLSADPNTSVLLLEAGEADPIPAAHQPNLWRSFWKTKIDWGYVTEPQPGYGGRSIDCPRGKVLGGSSVINTLVYIRGNRRDYDGWRDAGNPGWGYDDLLPLFRKSERNSRGASEYHGDDGPLAVTDPPAPHPLSPLMIEAAVELGHVRNPDFNGTEQMGTGLYQTTVSNGRRHSTADAFLLPVLQRPNLHVQTDAHVVAILFETKTATGVSYLQSGVRKEASANREMILAAGAIDSPKLLLLSGVGPSDQLSQFGISPVVDLPGVGNNLHDHPLVGVACATRSAIPVHDSSNVMEVGLFAYSPSASGARAPEIQFHIGPATSPGHAARGIAGGLSLTPGVLRPESRGTLRLRSANPGDAPRISPNYLDEARDLAILREGLVMAREIAHSTTLVHAGVEETHPGPTVKGNAELDAYIRNTGRCIFHPVGTCKMGSDAMAVVDPSLRVIGVNRLRVADGSIMPTITSGNTNAPIIMIAEKAAELILSERR